MDQDKPTEPAAEQSASLESNDDAVQSSSLEQSDDATTPNAPDGGAPATGGPLPKKPGGIKAIFRKVNIYLLIFVLLMVIAGVVTATTYLNSQKQPDQPAIVNQNLTPEGLKQLATSNSTIGDTGQTLTVQGNAIFSGQALVRGNLNVAGNLQLGGDITVQNLTASGNASLAQTQAQSLQVAQGTVLKGAATLQNDLSVTGSTSFNGPVTANQITVTNLILSGNARLSVPNHIAFTGASPGRSIDHSVLGSGGSASVSGSDATGTINLNTGSNPRSGCFVTMTFNKQYTSTPHVVMTPIDSSAGALDWYVSRNVSTVRLCTANTPPAHARFAFDYFITD